MTGRDDSRAPERERRDLHGPYYFDLQPGEAVRGFQAVGVGRRLALRGRHRFSICSHDVLVTAIARARKRSAEFPDLIGRPYRIAPR